MEILVEKRTGKKEAFNPEKIKEAILKAYKSSDEIASEYVDEVVEKIVDEIKEIIHRNVDKSSNIEKNIHRNVITIDNIQKIVEKYLMFCIDADFLPYEVIRKYILYRDRRDKDRESINKLATTFHDVIDIEDNNIKKGNANINGNTPSGQMMLFASETSKDHAFNFIISPKYVQAHKNGYIHIHDADYYSTKATNCNQIDLVELFNKKYIYTNDSVMRQPKRISSFGALASIILQSEQNEMFGGQAIHSWDYAMAKGVALSFIENFNMYKELTNENSIIFKDEDIKIGNEQLKEYYPKTYRLALAKTKKDTHETMAAFIYNCCSMHARGGGQVVFSSINYGTDDSPEGRIVIEETLNAVDEGLGDGSTAIFPISVFRVKDGINFTEEDWQKAVNNWEDAISGKIKFKAPNFDLFLKSCVVSSRRLFPNYMFLDSTFNHNDLWKKEDPNRYLYEAATMGCRTRVYDNIFGEKSNAKRGNLSFTTINLPRLAIEAVKESKTSAISVFFGKLDYYLNLVHDQLLERYKWQCSAYAKQFPFIVNNATLKGTEELSSDSKMENALKHGTLSIGFIGLAEALKELTGKHHGESEKSQELGLAIVNHMREFTDSKIKEDNLNWSLFATPAEGLSGRFTAIDKKEFGIIEGVTDRDYYTNSSHVPVYYNISAIDKIRTEAPYHELENAGHILYIELDGDPRKNPLAFAKIIVEMKNNNVGYGAINHSNDRCLKCGYEGIIEDGEACPKCGDMNISHLRRITGYLVGSTDRWNSFKLAELKDRVKHN